MIVYGFTVVKYPEIPERESVSTTTRVFATKVDWEQALEAHIPEDNEEINTFETNLE